MRKIIFLLFLISFSALQAQFNIILDYRFDNGYFSNNPERKAVLEYVAGLWEQVIITNAELPAGSSFNRRFDYTKAGTRNITFDQTQNGYVLLIYAHDFGKEVTANGNADPSTSKAYGGCYGIGTNLGYLAINTNASRPWFFDQSPQTAYDVPVNTHYDFITTATHEIGHALGILRMNMNQYVIQQNGRDYFNGPNAKRVNNGKPIPLVKESSHIHGDFWNDQYLVCPPLDRHVMHTHDPVQGFRQIMTMIDVAIMDDIGWDVNYRNIPTYPYTPKQDPRKKQLKSYYGISDYTLNPKGLWEFDQFSYVDDAIIGYPLRYAPPYRQAKGIKDLYVSSQRCIRIPQHGFLYCAHNLPANGGGNDVNQYTLVFDVKVESIGEYRALYNCNYNHKNDAEFFINKNGYFGRGQNYSTKAVTPNEWMRLVICIDARYGVASFYKNGLYSHQREISLDGKYSMYSNQTKDALIALFGDDDGEDNTIDVKRVILYDKALTSAQVKKLGGVFNTSFGL